MLPILCGFGKKKNMPLFVGVLKPYNWRINEMGKNVSLAKHEIRIPVVINI